MGFDHACYMRRETRHPNPTFSNQPPWRFLRAGRLVDCEQEQRQCASYRLNITYLTAPAIRCILMNAVSGMGMIRSFDEADRIGASG